MVSSGKKWEGSSTLTLSLCQIQNKIHFSLNKSPTLCYYNIRARGINAIRTGLARKLVPLPSFGELPSFPLALEGIHATFESEGFFQLNAFSA